jgi:hypothetical protein
MIHDIFSSTCDNFQYLLFTVLYCTRRRIKKVKRKTVLGLYFPHHKKSNFLTSIAKRQLVYKFPSNNLDQIRTFHIYINAVYYTLSYNFYVLYELLGQLQSCIFNFGTENIGKCKINAKSNLSQILNILQDRQDYTSLSLVKSRLCKGQFLMCI